MNLAQMRRSTGGLWVLPALGAAAAANAQTPADTLGWHFTGNLGYVQTSGNSQLTTVNLGEQIINRPSLNWTFTQTGGWVYGKTSGVESANQILSSFRGDYNIHPRLSAYGLIGYERNQFAGIDRRLEETTGLSWKAVSLPRHVLTLEIGAGGNQQLSGGVTTSFAVGRVAPKYRYNISDKAYFEQFVELLENLGDTGDLRAQSTSTLVAPLTARIALRFGYLMRYDAETAPLSPVPAPPVSPFYQKLDTTFTSGMQITL